MLQTLFNWLAEPWVAGGLVAFSLVAVLCSVLFVPRFLAKLPPDYLSGAKPRHSRSVPLRVLQNVLGVILTLLGVAMLVLPGQGLLTLLVGVLLVDFPGKHALVVRVLSRPKVLTIVNKLRARHGAGPLAP